jgi:CRP/FNR family transcriptional regulator
MNWTRHIPGLSRLEPGIADALERAGRVATLPSGSRIYGPGQPPESFLLLIDGTVRVQQVSESGREIVLYRVNTGESCALTTACLMSYEDYLAEAIAETDIQAVAIPRAVFDELVGRSPAFRQFVFQAFSSRITDLFRIIEDVAFQRLDNRLAQKLVELSRGGATVAATQQQLASELGTAREVVSRVLGELARRGLIQIGRGSIALIDRPGLDKLASGR